MEAPEREEGGDPLRETCSGDDRRKRVGRGSRGRGGRERGRGGGIEREGKAYPFPIRLPPRGYGFHLEGPCVVVDVSLCLATLGMPEYGRDGSFHLGRKGEEGGRGGVL